MSLKEKLVIKLIITLIEYLSKDIDGFNTYTFKKEVENLINEKRGE